MESLTAICQQIKQASSILVLSGAGMSTESGIPDFRSADGLYATPYQNLNPETILSHSFFMKHPDIFWQYAADKLNFQGIQPNVGHQVLALWEQTKNIQIVTQNIDGLHQAAGSQHVIEIHGTLKQAHCMNCYEQYSFEQVIPNHFHCHCQGIIRPDIVLYEEPVEKMALLNPIIEKADLLLVIGTSLTVYPIAALPQFFLQQHKPVIIINRDQTPYYQQAIEINASIGQTLKTINENLNLMSK